MPNIQLSDKIHNSELMSEKERERMAEQFSLVTQEMIDELPEEIRT